MIYTGPPFVRKPKVNKNPIPRSKRKFKSKSCKTCGTWFITLNMDVTCSDQCQQEHKKATARIHRASDVGKAAKDRRRARKRNAFVENVYRKRVFEADGYRCHLCKKKTDPMKKSPHPRSPTLDHIIPLAAGGTHEPSNCRTACFLCNALKGDRGGGEQLLLIG
jgi:5-methylcytosine-specific restriction endonuclease McrA